jgi:AcrR family transcriptional regulator
VSSAATTSGFVVHDERERLLAVFAELVAERGLDHARLEDAAEAAGISATTARSYFADEEECAFAAEDVASRQCFSAVAEAFMQTPGDCPRAAHAALRAMLRYMAASPAFVTLLVVEFPRLGPRAVALRQRYVDLFAEFLTPGFAAAPEPLPQPQLIAQMIGGGILEVIRRHAVEGRIAQLPEALPAISFLAIAPFFGLAEAQRVTRSSH